MFMHNDRIMSLRGFLPSIKNDELTHLNLDPLGIADDIDLEEAGRVIMANNSIVTCKIARFIESGREFSIDLNVHREANIARYQPLFLGLSQNKSLQHLGLFASDICEGTSKLFQGENISILKLWSCKITVDIFAVLEKTRLSLNELEIWDCIFKVDNRPLQRAETESLHKSFELDRLTLYNNNFDERGYEGLTRFLLNTNATLSEIDISNAIDTQWQPSFFNSIKECKSLEKLSFTRCCYEDDVALLVSALSNLPLRDLELSANEIGIDAARAISDLIYQNRTIKTLNLERLGNPGDGSIQGIPDDAMLPLVDALANNCTLKTFEFSHCEGSVSPEDWVEFSRVLGSSRSALKKIYLHGNAINDDVIIAFAHELSQNPDSKLKHLDISKLDSDYFSISNVSWDALLNLLCNTSSIDATWSSNHTLCNLGDFSIGETDNDSEYEVKMPQNVHALLEMNKHKDKKQVARMKVIENHFAGDFDVNALACNEKKLLPRAISWLGKDSLGCSAVYYMVRAMPEICESDQTNGPRNSKRIKMNHDNR